MTVWRIYKRNICLPLLAISANCLFTEFFVFSASSGAYLLARQQSIRINLCLLNPNSIHLAIYMQVFMDMLSCQKKDQNQIGKNIFFLKNLPFKKHSDIEDISTPAMVVGFKSFQTGLANIKERDIPLSYTCT